MLRSFLLFPGQQLIERGFVIEQAGRGLLNRLSQMEQRAIDVEEQAFGMFFNAAHGNQRTVFFRVYGELTILPDLKPGLDHNHRNHKCHEKKQDMQDA